MSWKKKAAEEKRKGATKNQFAHFKAALQNEKHAKAAAKKQTQANTFTRQEMIVINTDCLEMIHDFCHSHSQRDSQVWYFGNNAEISLLICLATGCQ